MKATRLGSSSETNGGDTGMIPFLAITGAPTEAECRAKVAAIEAAGAGSFLLYARSGLALEYMGEEWLRLAEWFCDEASRRGLRVWLYDEYNWPSGTCKGRVPRENPAWRYREIGVFPREGGAWRWEEAAAPDGWVNVCEPDAVRRFVELTHDAYAARLARFFEDGTVVGFFTDEPGHPTRVRWESGEPAVSFRVWSGLEDEYRAETGREFRSDVEAWLAAPSSAPDLPATYARLLGRRFRTSYFDQIRRWCDAHGVALTGHLIDENGLSGSSWLNGDPMLCLRGETIPGMDEIGTAFDPDGKASRPPEWVTFNLARQAILHNGRGGMAELFACGPGDLPPAALRQMLWMCAFHGIDRYVTCMDVMDERGFVEKHGYVSAAGPVHPWYERHARILADEARRAAAFAAKRVSGREVGVRYPDRAAAAAAFTRGAPLPDALALLGALETRQFVPRFVREDEPCDLPLVFVCRADGLFDEEKTGATGLDAEGAVALCRERLPATFRVFEADGATEADALLARTCEDGASAVVNMRPFATRRLVAERDGERVEFMLPPHGVRVFEPGALPPGDRSVAESRSLAAVEWRVVRDRPNLLRVTFAEGGGREGSVTFAETVEAREVRLLNAALPGSAGFQPAEGTAVSGRANPGSVGFQPAVMGGAASGRAALADEARQDAAPPFAALFAPLYRTDSARRFEAGIHRFEIDHPDANYFLPALWLAGDFRVLGGTVFAERADAPAAFGSFAELGYPHYAGALTWRATVAAPSGGAGWRLRADTGGAVASARFCGVELGACAWAPFEWNVPPELAGQAGELEITVFSSAQPMFGPYDAPGAAWDCRLWFGDHAPGAACGLLSASWVR